MEHGAAVKPRIERNRLTKRSTLFVAACVVSAGAFVTVVAADLSSRTASSRVVVAASTDTTSTAPAPDSTAATQVTEAPTACSVGATSATNAEPANPQVAYRIAHFPPALAPPADVQPMTANVAIQDARSIVGRGGTVGEAPDRASAPAIAAEMSYQDLIKLAHTYVGVDPDIAGDRCVFVVTVNAPYSESAPPGRPAQTVSVYNVIYDVASSHPIASVAGVAILK